MTRRKLRQDELDLWNQVAARTDRLTKTSLAKARFVVDMPQPETTPATVRKAQATILGKPKGKSPARPHSLAPAIDEQIARTPVQMDNKSFGKMKRGKLRPEGRIDLHGMTLDRAHPALTSFVMNAHAQGKRLVLVITGKGKHRDEGGPIPTRMGVLRHQVPQWLKMQPMSSVVLQVAQAHISHGGGGAYYVYLRRHR
ncbi:Smr/MutS family protein [Sulfitobacter sp. S190]|uniref:Smr/MutS family protein n=1 Tax=Sulfitobacter sp. S190 TaxID=2867022 RepID=UPI0021A955EA|nr:Smr/MutS family protein [Sulfitobacter sp. S190]UWR22461.1 Smr/MutS family protein [Sulfitobacter sp. S190]